MPNLFTKKILIFIIFFLVIFLLPQLIFAATSPDAIATRVIPNPDHLSPMRWYQTNIKNQGSPQALTVDGYEAIRDGRTVYVNAANISGNNFYTNIYLLSFNQDVEQATEDIFSQLLSHWKFNTNIPPGNKDNVRKDTKRLAGLAEIKLALDDYQKEHNSDYPSLTAGSYVAGKSLSVWPSWQATLGKELAATLPVDPVNELGACPAGYDAETCWNQTEKRFAGVPDNSQAYIYTYNGLGSYNVCALMQSGYLTTLDQGACTGSAIGYEVICEDWVWTYEVDRATICSNQTITETSDCGNTRNILYGTRVDTVWTPNTPLNQVCTNQIVTETGDCNGTRNITHGTKTDTVWTPNTPLNQTCTSQTVVETGNCNGTRNITHGTKTDTAWTPNTPLNQVCTNQIVTETGDCGATRNITYGTKCCSTCSAINQPNCQTGAPANSEAGIGVCCGGQFCYKCQNNYYWSGGVCAAGTQTVNCTAKPDYTDWNTSSTVLQTWDGLAWQPSNSSFYDATAGTCKYKCQSGYSWNGSACVINCTPVNATLSGWGACSATCGGGTQTQTCSGASCGGDATCGGAPLSQSCNTQACCSPDCSGRNCGDDGCSGSCGTCSATQSCSGAGVCVNNCTPNCTATHNCGDDGCGGSCGTCSSGNFCTNGSCCTAQAGIQVCSDNCHDTYFNGSAVSNACNWGSVQQFDVTVQSDKNVIAIKASDQGGLYGVSATLNRAGCFSMTTDDLANWKCVDYNPGNGWTDINYNDSSWPDAVLGDPGTAGIRGGNYLTYQQIWAQGAGEGTTVYCRYTFMAN